MTTNINPGRTVVLATDGACLGNPGTGGWAVVINELDGDAIISRYALAGRADGTTTNQRMELTAAYEGLKYLGASLIPATVLSDSRYLVDGMSQWRDGWKANGWRKGDRKPVANVDLWIALDEMCPPARPVQWQWTRGHDGHDLNEIADKLANKAALGAFDDPAVSLMELHPELFQGSPKRCCVS